LIDFEEIHKRLFVGQQERERVAFTVRPRRSAASMNKRVDELGRFVLNDPVDVVHVDATRQYVRAHQNASFYYRRREMREISDELMPLTSTYEFRFLNSLNIFVRLSFIFLCISNTFDPLRSKLFRIREKY
jgi:hypothetical protein